MDDPVRLVAWQLVTQATVCRTMGSPLGAHLLEVAAADVLAGGPVAELLVPRARPDRGDAAALRFLAAVHRLVLERRAPALALHLPTVGGTTDLRSVPAVLLATVAEHRAELEDLVELPCQTNEVGRSVGLLTGLLPVAAAHGLPLRLLEVGASAGLNLRLDRFAYRVPLADGGSHVLGPPDAEVRFEDNLQGPVPGAPTALPAVASRQGCDLRPLDPTAASTRLAVSASVWPDQVDRFRRLGAALRVAAEVPATVSQASAAAWVSRQLERPADGVVSVVLHSVVEEYLPGPERRALHDAVAEAGARATARAPVAHVRFEPVDGLRGVAVEVRHFPDAPDWRRVAVADAHGRAVTPIAG